MEKEGGKSDIMIKICRPKIKKATGMDNVKQKVKLFPRSKPKMLYLNEFLFLFIHSVWGRDLSKESENWWRKTNIIL